MATTPATLEGPHEPMPTATKPSAAFASVRRKDFLLTPPGIVTFHHLVDPDTAFDSVKFNVSLAMTDPALVRLGELLQRDVIDANWEAFLKEADGKGIKREFTKPSGRVWVEEHLKQPGETARVKLPFVQFANEADYLDRDGKPKRKVMKAYDKDNVLLDLATLSLGSGTKAQVIIVGGLFVSALVKQPQPTLKLQGLRVIELVTYGAGGGGQLGELTDDDMAMLEGDVNASDLGDYAASHKTGRSDSTVEEDLPF